MNPTEGQLPLSVNGRPVPTLLLSDFLEGDTRRATTFITNFGNWQLSGPPAQALGADLVRVEWFHDTGELVAIGDIPERGEASVEVSATQGGIDAVEDVLPFDKEGRRARGADGEVREFFPAMIVAEGTRAAILAVVDSGPRVHELLWGWHQHHRRSDGWSWLEQRLPA